MVCLIAVKLKAIRQSPAVSAHGLQPLDFAGLSADLHGGGTGPAGGGQHQQFIALRNTELMNQCHG